jgi:hypothetical protein
MRFHAVVLALLAGFAVIVVARLDRVSAQTPPAFEQARAEPSRVDESTGRLTALEKVTTKLVKERNKFYAYVDGAASTVAFKRGEAVKFAVLQMGPSKADEWPKHVEDVRKRPFLVLERLAVQDGRRFATDKFVSLDISTYGQVIVGVDSKKPERGAKSFLYVPTERLAPGEYALAFAPGLFQCAQCKDAWGWAFSVVDR